MINPYTGQEDPMAGMPGFAGAPPASMPPPPLNLGGDAPMAPGTAGGAPPEIQSAMATLQQVNAVLGPSGGGAPAQPPPALPGPGASLPQQQAGIRQAQVGGIQQARGIEQEQAVVDDQAGAARLGTAQAQADAAIARSRANDQKLQEQQALETLYDQKQKVAQETSRKAAELWTQAKPTEWFDKAETGTKAMTILSMALAHAFDAYKGVQGQQSNLGQQANRMLDGILDDHRTQEIARIEKLGLGAKQAAGQVDQTQRERAALLSKIEDKYAGIEKGLELAAKTKLAELGYDQAEAENHQVVVDRKRRALEAEQRQINAYSGFVDSDMAQMLRARKGSGGPAGPKPLTEYQQMMKDRHDDELAIPNLDGSPAGHAKTKAEAVKIRKGQEATASFVDNLNRMKAFVEKEGTILVPGFEQSQRKERTALTTALAGNLTLMNETGVLNAGEYSRYAAMIEPSMWEKNANAAELMGKLAVKAEQDYARKVRSQGVVGEKPAEQGPTTPATLPQAKPAGTSKFAPEDVEALNEALKLKKTNPNDWRIQWTEDYLRQKYGAASGL